MENTAANARAVATLPHPVDPSEVSSSPTIHVDAPTKSKTFPVHQHVEPNAGLSPASPTSAGEDGHPSPRAHIMFLNTDVDGMDGTATASPVEMKPGSARNSVRNKPFLLETTGISDSPTASSIRLADMARASPGPSPILRPAGAELARGSPGPSPLLHPTQGGPEPRHFAISDSSPASPASATHAPAKDVTGHSLPLTARMPDEIPTAPNPSVPEPKRETADDMPVLEKKESQPIRWDKAGGIRLVRAESELPPEGKGSKRMYQMSKMFSMSHAFPSQPVY